jgi:26S proteasome regulatory subunit N5
MPTPCAQETFGAMAKTEKVFYILEQVRLCLDRKDFVRAQILAKKVSPRAFVEQPGKKGVAAGEIGIEGTTIEHPDEVGTATPGINPHWDMVSSPGLGASC